MRTLTICILALISALSIHAQDSGNVAATLKGKVVNTASNRPVAYTNIGIENTLYGTASDAEGNFELKIPAEMADKNIYFSAVGYSNKLFPVKGLFNKTFSIIKLDEQSYGVDKVDVAGQNRVLIRILRMASENIKYNYGTGPFNLHCSYNNEVTVNEEVQAPKIASVLIYDESGYSKVSKKDAYNARKYAVEKEQSADDYTFSTALLNLDDLLDLDWVRSASNVLNPALLADYTLTLESQPTINGKEYWVIAFKQNEPTLEGSGSLYSTAFEGKITIKKEDYSVDSFVFNSAASKQNKQGRGLAVSDSNSDFLLDVNYACKVEYKDLLINTIVMNRQYTYNGNEVAETTTLVVDRAHANDVTILETRDYYAGE
jgi:hypothetical protein